MTNTADKRSVATDALENLGTFPIPDNSGRDAIHLAVEPVIAAERLFPGQHIGFVEGGVGACANPLGIVDPFIAGTVHPGQRFWMVIYPRQITSLRHVWSHPAFPEKTAEEYHAEADEHYVAPQSESEVWLRKYADVIDEPFDKLMTAADRWVASGDYFYGTACGDPGEEYYGKFEGERTNPEFWTHYQAYRGVVIPASKQQSFFTCSC